MSDRSEPSPDPPGTPGSPDTGPAGTAIVTHPASAPTAAPRRRGVIPTVEGHVTPPGTQVFGMWIFLLSLGMLFIASMLGYALIRWKLHTEGFAPLGTLSQHGGLPLGLFASTLVILASSVTVSLALTAARHENQSRMRAMLAATLALGVLFMLVQFPSLWVLYERNADTVAATSTDTNETPAIGLFALVLFLVLVHAAHVLGGVIPLGWTTLRAYQGFYDHEHHQPVRLVAMYWHFLDGVWLVMFALFLAMG